MLVDMTPGAQAHPISINLTGVVDKTISIHGTSGFI